MSKIGHLADRLLSLAVPTTQAAAICPPDLECNSFIRPGMCKCYQTGWQNGVCRTWVVYVPGCTLD